MEDKDLTIPQNDYNKDVAKDFDKRNYKQVDRLIEADISHLQRKAQSQGREISQGEALEHFKKKGFLKSEAGAHLVDKRMKGLKNLPEVDYYKKEARQKREEMVKEFL